MVRILAIFLALLSAPALAEGPRDCIGQVPCIVGDRSYHVREPENWDGQSKLPVMLHFHGWARQGTLIVKHGRIAGATSPRGVLLVAPNGRNKTWNFWSAGTSDVDFAQTVLDDVSKRYPVDLENVFVSGYSYGSAMAWRFACDNGTEVRALLAVSGTLDQDEDCATAPQEIRHVHGLKDNVMDFPFGPGGDVLHPVSLWRRELGCSTPTGMDAFSLTEKDHFERTIWADCEAGQQVILDLHPRGHFIPRGWFAKQLDELLPSAAG